MLGNGGEIGAKKPLLFGLFRIRQQGVSTIACRKMEKGPENRPFS